MSAIQTAIQFNVGIQTQIIQVNQAMLDVAASTNRAVEQQSNYEAATEKSEASTNKLTQKLKSLAGAFEPLKAAKDLLGVSDQVTQIKARLNLVADGSSVDELNQKIMDSANNARLSYMDTADAVLNFATNAKGAFSSNDEIIAFTKVYSKMLAVSGAGQAEISAASEQMAQALSDGVLQGEELGAVFGTTPQAIQAMADYLGRPTEEIRKMAEEGQLTSDIVKNSLLSATDSVNEQFGNMPMTWSQVGTLAINQLIDASQPLLTLISGIAQHWEALEPVVVAVSAAIAVYAAAQGIFAMATWISTGAAKQFALALLSNPLTYIALAIAVVVYFIYQWIQSVGGIQIAWKICMNAILTAWDWVKIGLVTGVFWVMNKLSLFMLLVKTISTSIANFFGDMRVNIMLILQDMVNGSIDIINKLITSLNKIPGVEIDSIEHVTFGAAAQAENEAAKQSRNSELAAYENDVNAGIAARNATVEQMKREARADTAKRQAEIHKLQLEKQSGSSAVSEAQKSNMADKDRDKSAKETAKNTYKTAQAADAIKDSLDITSENIKYVRDFSTERAVNRHTATQVRVEMTNHNSISGDQDIDGIVNKLSTRIQETMSSSAEGVH